MEGRVQTASWGESTCHGDYIQLGGRHVGSWRSPRSWVGVQERRWAVTSMQERVRRWVCEVGACGALHASGERID